MVTDYLIRIEPIIREQTGQSRIDALHNIYEELLAELGTVKIDIEVLSKTIDLLDTMGFKYSEESKQLDALQAIHSELVDIKEKLDSVLAKLN